MSGTLPSGGIRTNVGTEGKVVEQANDSEVRREA